MTAIKYTLGLPRIPPKTLVGNYNNSSALPTALDSSDLTPIITNSLGTIPLIATIGSSTIARAEESDAAGGRVRTFGGVVNAMNILCQGRAYCPRSYSRAVSGETSTQFASRQLQEVLALSPRPKGCFFLPGAGDILNGVAWSTTKTNIDTVISGLLDANIIPILGIPQAFLGQSTTMQKQLARIAVYLRNYAQAYRNIILVDPVGQFIDPSLSTYESLNAYMDSNSPRIHLNHWGTQLYGLAISQALIDAGWPKYNVGLKSNGDLYDATNNEYGNLIANGMLSGTTGSPISGATGTSPTGFGFASGVGGTTVLSQPGSGLGCTITFSGSATAGGNALVLYHDLTAPELAQINVNDNLQMIVEFDSGTLTNVQAIRTALRMTISGTTYDDLDGGSITQSGPLTAITSGVMRPLPRICTAVPTAASVRLQIYPENNAAWSGSVTWKSVALRKII